MCTRMTIICLVVKTCYLKLICVVCNGVTHRRSVTMARDHILNFVLFLPCFPVIWTARVKHDYKASATTHREKRDRPIPGGWDFSDIISSPDVSHKFPSTSACHVQLRWLSLPPQYHKSQETQNLLSVQQFHLFTYALHTYTWLFDNIPRINFLWYDNDDNFTTRMTIYSCTPLVGLHDR